MTPLRPYLRDARGFTLIEVLLATLLMTVILGALATVTSQWLPNWNRGMAQVQRAERLSIGLSRVVADIAAAQMTPRNATSKGPLFQGNELSLVFVRSAVGPNTRPGLEIVRFVEKADRQGLALVRERAVFTPSPDDAQIGFADPVVLMRVPHRVSFAYAGRDRVWQPTWRDRKELPRAVRVSVRDMNTGQVIAASSVALVHVDAPADCARAKDAVSCIAAFAREQPNEQQL